MITHATATNSLSNNTQDNNNASDLINYLLYSKNPKLKATSTRISTSDLYQKGLIYKTLINKKALKQKSELEKEQLKECTFHPKITFYKQINKDPLRNSTKSYNRHLLRERDRNKNKEKGLICSTEPSTIHPLKKTFKEIDIFTNHLYQYHNKYKMHINVLSKTFEKSSCPFTPKINQGGVATKTINEPFDQRMSLWSQKQKEKKKTLNDKELYDKKTGKPLFNPVLLTKDNKPPLSNATSKRKESYHLFEGYRRKQMNNKEKQEALNSKFIELSNLKLIDNKSARIANELYTQTYKRIFTKISNGNPILSKDNIHINHITPHVKHFINPLTEELLTTNETLNEIEFIRGCEYLIKRLSINERNILIHSKEI